MMHVFMTIHTCTLISLLPPPFLPVSLRASFLDHLEQWRSEMIRTAEEMVEGKVRLIHRAEAE